MHILRRIFDLYLQGSMHVALSAFCLIRVTEVVLGLEQNPYLEGFGYFGTIVGYNFIKYDALARSGRPKFSLNLKLFITISVLAFMGTVYCFFKLNLLTQIVSVAVLAITVLYALPFFPNHKNARSWAGLKIYIVALSWVGVTVVLPVMNSDTTITNDFYIICIKRFILIVVLLFIFEIIDLAWDDPHLKTVPQQIGVNNTKRLGLALLVLFLLLELVQAGKNVPYFIASVGLIIVTAVFLHFAEQSRSRYYTTFWAESIPIFWYLMIVFAAYL
jgi:hypothetical protein